VKYAVLFEKGPKSWGASVPDLPGCVAVADTREGVEQLIQEAIELHLEGSGKMACRLQGRSTRSPSSK